MLLFALSIIGILIGLIIICKKTVLPRCCPCGKKVVNLIAGKLMFNSILRALMQTYLLNCIAMWYSLSTTNVSDSEGIVDLTLAIVILTFSLAFPICTYLFLKKNEEILREPRFKVKFDSIYQNLDYYKKKALVHTSIFLGRRIYIAFIVVFCGFSIVLQVALADVLSTLLLAYFLSVMPMMDRLNNAVQIFNEIVVIVCIWLCIHFTEYVPDP